MKKKLPVAVWWIFRVKKQPFLIIFYIIKQNLKVVVIVNDMSEVNVDGN